MGVSRRLYLSWRSRAEKQNAEWMERAQWLEDRSRAGSQKAVCVGGGLVEKILWERESAANRA